MAMTVKKAVKPVKESKEKEVVTGTKGTEGAKVSEVSKVPEAKKKKVLKAKIKDDSGQARMTVDKKITKNDSGPAFAEATAGKQVRMTTEKKEIVKPPVKEPTTMEELLAIEGEKVRGLRKGEVVEGVIIDVNPRSVFIDVGAKTEGVVLGREYEKEKEFIRSLKPGDKVQCYVGDPESEKGQILLSLRQAAGNFAWDKYTLLLKSGDTVEVRGREVNRGGLIVDAPFALQGFVPGSQIGSVWQGKMDMLVGRSLAVKVIEVNREQNRLVFSEKQISDAEKIAKVAKVISGLKVEQEFEAIITQVAPFGLFVRVKVGDDDVEGLVHISEVSWQKVEDLAAFFKAKDGVKVRVISVENGRVQFSIKQLLTDPWQKLEEEYPVESKIKGKITRLTSFGALVELEPGIEGLVHISKIPPEMVIAEGDKMTVYIESVDRKSRRISLGLVLTEKPIGYK